MWGKSPSGLSQSTVDNLFVSRAVTNWVEKGVLVAKKILVGNEGDRVNTYFRDFEKMPLCSFIVSDHADKISLIKATSVSEFSAMTQLHTSIPEAMAEGVLTPKGS